MKVEIDPKTNTPKFKLEEKDLKDAIEIQLMMETKGWGILKDYYEVARESLLEAGKDGIRGRSKVDLSAEKWAILKGWDERGFVPYRVIQRAEQFNKDEEANKEGDHARPDFTGQEDAG